MVGLIAGMKLERHPCPCSFARACEERDPTKFPRAGWVTNVLYRCAPYMRHEGTARLCVEVEPKDCCWTWFGMDKPTPPPEGDGK